MIDKKDLEQTIEQYSNMLYRLCLMIVKNEQDTQDILQETFLKYMKSAPAFKSNEHKKAWLIKVSQNKCKDFLRFHKRHLHVPIHEVEEIIDLYQSSSVSDKEEFEFLWELEAKYKSVVILHYIEGYSMEEIADILNISVAAARKRLQRAKIYLKDKRNSFNNGETAYE